MRFNTKVKNCTLCLDLAATRTNVVLGEGPIPSDIVFLGEAPGATEDRLGLPFKGNAGQLLRTDAYVAGLREGEDFHLLNMLKCRPPGNRDPYMEELRNCLPFLMHQLAAIKPKVIVCMGRYAQAFVLQKQPRAIRVTHNVGKVVKIKRTIKNAKPKALLTFHPSYVLRNRGNEIEDAFIAHLKLARRMACTAPTAK
jgi:DNA polymerase